MSIPVFQPQGPANNCVIHGRELGWLSCTSFGCAMAADAATNGLVQIDGCSLREMTGDTIGGLMLSQVRGPLLQLGVPTELHVGANVATPAYVARRLAAGRPVALQGNTGALDGTPFKDTDGSINHLTAIIAVRGGTSDVPKEALVYDPAADGRRAGIAQAPDWWPWPLVLKFAARLHPWGEDDPRLLGPGKFYCLIFPAPPPILPDTGTGGYTLHIKANATVRVYDLQKGNRPVACISAWHDVRWGSRGSSVPCTKPVHRETCDGKSGAVTVKVLSGRTFKDRYVLVGRGTTVTGG